MVDKLLRGPQEVEVFYILPAVRKELSISLKQIGLDQKQIAKLLNVTEPAISQYMKEKRASEIQFGDEIKTEIKKAAERLIKGSKLLNETQNILNLIKNSKHTCIVCKQRTSAEPACRVCFD